MNNIIKKILEKIIENGYEAYIVGGYVRDHLLGFNSSDIDICTNALIKDLLEIFQGNINDCGSLNIKTNDLNIDITTLREEGKYFKHKPLEIKYTSNLENDLKRRDFTINTICMDINENIIDYLKGRDDLDKKIIRIVGNNEEKLKQDPLRILRAIRFATILDFQIEKSLDQTILKNACLVNEVSNYRVKEELSKILLSAHYQKGLDLIKKYKIDEYLNISYQHLVYTKDLCGMWAQLKYPKELPFTKNEKNNIVKIREILKIGIINSEIIYTYGLYNATIAGEILGINIESIHDIYQNMPIYLRKDLNITYLDIANILDLKPSKKVKIIEDKILKEVLNKRIINSYEEIKKYLIINRGDLINE